MDTPSGFRNAGGQKPGRRKPPTTQPQPQLFEDTSQQPQYGGQQYPGPGSPPQQPYAQPPASFPSSGPGYDTAAGFGSPTHGPAGGFDPQNLINDPMASMAVSYGQNFAGQGKEYVQQNLEKYMSKSRIKYYFAVDTSYVGKKLALLIFPYTHSDWSIKYSQDEPVAPRYEINAPDLYIPVMAFVTYILLAGFILGTQNKFAPEVLGIQASTAFVWLIIEILAILFTLYIMNVSTDLKYLDLLAYSGYKYVGMIFSMIAGLFFHSGGYYLVLIYTSCAIVFFLIRTLRVQVLPHSDPDSYAHGNKRRTYLLLFVAGIQPVFMWWLTGHLVGASAPPMR